MATPSARHWHVATSAAGSTTTTERGVIETVQKRNQDRLLGDMVRAMTNLFGKSNDGKTANLRGVGN